MTDFIPRIGNRVEDITRFKEKIQSIPIRIIVEGTRGKSSAAMMLGEMLRNQGKNTLVKVTGENPLLIYNGVIFPLYRKRDLVLLDYELVPGILNFDVDAIVFENQAITPYTMKYYHKALDPQYVIIPNIRVDHPESLGNTLPEMVQNFADNYRATRTLKEIYYVEPIREVHDIVYPILRKQADMYPGKILLFDIPVIEKWRDLPGIENYLVNSFFIEHNYGILIEDEVYIQNLQRLLQVWKSPSGIKYMNLAKVNDPSSFLRILIYMLKITSYDIALAGYLRRDRAGRIKIFEDIFPEMEERFGSRMKKIWIAGYGADHMFNTLSPSLQQITDYGVTIKDIPDILSYVKEHNLILITMINRVNSFMDVLVRELGIQR